MRIAVIVKIVPDDQDIQVAGDGSLDYSRAQQTISVYDLNAIEAAAKLAECSNDAQVYALAVGGPQIDESKVKKNILSRGVDELFMIAAPSAEGLDAHATAVALKKLVERVGSVDLILAGDGSADNYAQQVDVQLGFALGWPSVNAVTSLEAQNGTLTLKRRLEEEIETVELALPAVIAVSPDIALPRIPGMKDILAAGKKPMEVVPLQEEPVLALETVLVKAPEQVQRAQELLDQSDANAIEKFALAIKAAL